MALVWCSISAHGYGHAAQVIPVLNALARRRPDMRVIVRTGVAESFFSENLSMPWDYSASRQDIGCIQDGPLVIDVERTWEAYDRYVAGWDARLSEEVAAIQQVRPDLVMSNITPLGIAAGAQAGYPTAAVCSLSWDEILEPYATPGHRRHMEIIDHIRAAYGRATCAVRLFPGLPMKAFSSIVDVGPVARPSVAATDVVKTACGIEDGERLVLVAFGGVPVNELPLASLSALEGYRFLVSAELKGRDFPRVVSTSKIAASYPQMFAGADIVVTKPGYATMIEAVRTQTPVVYVRRHDFADEQLLVDCVTRYGRAQELSREEFSAGLWRPALDAAAAMPYSTEQVPADGADAAAECLVRMLDGAR